VRDVLVEQVADLQSSEQQLVSALSQMADAAFNHRLREAFQTHLEQTRTHADRLTRVASMLGTDMPSHECPAMKGLIAEVKDVIGATGDANAKDAALIAAAQRIEHHEIAAYGTVRALAAQLGLDDAAELLDQTLYEEHETDLQLTRLATGGMFASGINEQAHV